ncbi:MAG: hypothetical protein U5N53_22955 [Mycobacterium sp.]|nr:hypothetical protein [Mycobacterium sp.]
MKHFETFLDGADQNGSDTVNFPAWDIEFADPRRDRLLILARVVHQPVAPTCS